MHVFPWDAASPLRDRLLTAKDTDSEDSDAGGGGDFSDELDTLDDESELDTRDHEDDADRDGRGGTIDYKRRFADTKADRDNLKKKTEEQETELASLRQEIEALKDVRGQQGTKGADYGEERTKSMPDEMVLVDQISDAVNREYLALPKEKQNIRELTKLVVKNQLGASKDMVVRLANQIIEERKKEDQQKTDLRSMAGNALEEAGLDPKRHYSVLRGIIQDRIESDPTWFRRTPLKKQFEELAKDTRKLLTENGWVPKDKVKKANDEHRRDADGMIEGGSRRNNPRQAEDQDDDDRPSTMIDAMNANRRALVRRAGQSAAVARR